MKKIITLCFVVFMLMSVSVLSLHTTNYNVKSRLSETNVLDLNGMAGTSYAGVRGYMNAALNTHNGLWHSGSVWVQATGEDRTFDRISVKWKSHGNNYGTVEDSLSDSETTVSFLANGRVIRNRMVSYEEVMVSYDKTTGMLSVSGDGFSFVG